MTKITSFSAISFSVIFLKKLYPTVRVLERLTWVIIHCWCCKMIPSSTWLLTHWTWLTITWGDSNYFFLLFILFEPHFSLVGNNLASLDNKDLVVDLTNNNISFLLEKEFKEYIATRKNRGHCLLQVITEGGSIRSIIQFTLQGNPLSCSCDIRWILSLNYQWSRLLRGADCADGSKMSDVNHYFVYHCIYIYIII